MNGWVMRRADNLRDAGQWTRHAGQTVCLRSREGSGHYVYVFQKEERAIMVEEHDAAVKPAVLECHDRTLVGTSTDVYCLDRELRITGSFALASPFAKFHFSEARQRVIVACEIDLYCLNRDGGLLWHKPLSDILSACRLEGEAVICSLFEGGGLSVDIHTGEAVSAPA